MQQARAGNDEEDNPGQTRHHSQTWIKEFGGTESEKNGGEEIGCRSDEQIKHARENCAQRADEILRGLVWRRQITPRHPRWEIARAIGDQREEEQGAGE